ncbi:MAG: hypothetical protein ABIW47_06620 [Ginsengibacter sp.]|jgi:hypothetical protein
MEINTRAYHLYLIVYGGHALTKKFDEGIFPVQEECEKVIVEIEHEYIHLKKDLLQNPNRYMILNYCTGLYLGDEELPELKKKFSNSIIISKSDPCTIYINFEKESQFVYKYLVSQWLRLNSLV